MTKAIKFKFSGEVTLNPIWYDDQFFEELKKDGLSEEDALRCMIAVSFEESWTEVAEEMFRFQDHRGKAWREITDSVVKEFVDEVKLVDKDG